MRPIEDEVSILRRRMQVVESRLDNTRARDALPSLATNARLARVTNSTPEGDNYNLYAIKFLDGDFPDTTGSITVDYVDRQNGTAAYVCNVTGARIPQNTVILAYWWSNRWWTSYSTGAENEMALVRVDESPGISDCANVNVTFNGGWQGKVVGMNLAEALDSNAAYIDGADCWIVCVDHCPPATQLKKGERYIGRKVGQYTFSGQTRDLYQVESRSVGESSVDELILTNQTARENTATGTPIGRFLLSSYYETHWYTFANSYGSSSISHDPNNTNFTAGNGSQNFAINRTGCYEMEISAWYRLARTTGATVPSSVKFFKLTFVRKRTSFITLMGKLVPVVSQSTGWGATEGNETWGGEYQTETQLTYQNLTAGDTFQIGAYISENDDIDYFGVMIQNVRLRIRWVAPYNAIAQG